MNLSDLIGVGSSFDPRAFVELDITTSQNWVVPAAKNDKFYIIWQGGGGSGANAAYNYMFAFGGFGGEIKKDWFTFTAGTSVSIIIGIGGLGVSNTSAGINGNVGTDTIFNNIAARGGSKGINVSNYGVYSNEDGNKPIGIRPMHLDGGAVGNSTTYQSKLWRTTAVYEGEEINLWTPMGTLNVQQAKHQRIITNATIYGNNIATGGGCGLGGVSDGIVQGSAIDVSAVVTPLGAGSGGIIAVSGVTALNMSNAPGGNGIVKVYYEPV